MGFKEGGGLEHGLKELNAFEEGLKEGQGS